MNRIKHYITKNGLKVKWIAEQIGCHHTEISNWISGRRRPNVHRAIKLANLCSCSVEDLFPMGENIDDRQVIEETTTTRKYMPTQ